MPQLFRVGSYIIYFWSNESNPLEPVHVHIAMGNASANGTKVWITSTGRALVANNNAKIPERILMRLKGMIESNSDEIVARWEEHFGQISYYC